MSIKEIIFYLRRNAKQLDTIGDCEGEYEENYSELGEWFLEHCSEEVLDIAQSLLILARNLEGIKNEKTSETI